MLDGRFDNAMKILVFAPHAAIWIHAFPEALIAESLGQAGHEIVYVTCGKLFKDHCVPISAFGMRYDAGVEDKLKICDLCCRNANILRDEFGFKGRDLMSELSATDYTEVETLLAQVNRENFGTIEFEGLRIGRFALYQFLVLRKRIGLDFTDEEWSEYVLHFKATALAAAGLRHVFAREKPDRVLFYNGLYSVNIVCRELAARFGAISYFLHAGGSLARRLQTLIIGREHVFRFVPALLSHWAKHRERPVGLGPMRLVTDHYVELLRARTAFAYSVAKSDVLFDVRKRFGIGLTHRILVATMGSYDEEFAAQAVGALVYNRPALFATQADWIRELLSYVSRRSELFLIVRVHPRELPNRRERIKSEHAGVLESLLVNLPANAAVNWPTDNVSLYDLAEEADVFLNSWSSAGKEMSMLGRPVVTYAWEAILYPRDLNYTAVTVSAYFEEIERALGDGWNADRTKLAYRWLAIEYGVSLVGIDESYREHESRSPRLLERVLRKLARTVDPTLLQRLDCRRRAPALKEAGVVSRLIESGEETILDVVDPGATPEVSLAQETASLREEVRRLMQYLYPPGVVAKPGTLHAHLEDFASGVVCE